jgi:hypothetical protein
MSVSVKIAFAGPVADAVLPSTIPGGIRIEVDGTELTRNVNQTNYDKEAETKHPDKTWWYDSGGQPLDAHKFEYKGHVSIETTIRSFADNVTKMELGGVGRYEQLRSPVSDVAKNLILSYIDDEHELIRLAYQDTTGRVDADFNAPIDSAVGYAVPLDELCLEMARCLHEFVDYATSGDFDRSDLRFDEILDDAAELEKLATERS